MTAKRRSLPLSEVRETLDLLISYGIDVRQCNVDIRVDGVAVSPPVAKAGTAYDAWKAKDKDRDRPARRQ